MPTPINFQQAAAAPSAKSPTSPVAASAGWIFSMASTVKNKISHAVHGDSSDDDELSRKYVVSVSAGPSYDEATWKPVFVNSEQNCSFENEFAKVNVRVRVRDFNGLPKGSKSWSPYFDHEMHVKDHYSVGFEFVPKVALNAKDLVWGNDFKYPIRDRLPPGFNTAVGIAKHLVDPGITCDAYADEPWLYAPALGAWDAFRVGEKLDEKEIVNFGEKNEEPVIKDGADGSGVAVREKSGIPDGRDKRRKYFLSEAHREAFIFEKGRHYRGDFFNPYIDFNRFALRLPGFSIRVIKYVNDKSHTLRYVFKNNKTGDVYFVVVFQLLFGDDLKAALEKAEKGEAPVVGSTHIKHDSKTSNSANT